MPGIIFSLVFSRHTLSNTNFTVKHKLIIVAVFPKAHVMTFRRVQSYIIITEPFSHCPKILMKHPFD